MRGHDVLDGLPDGAHPIHAEGLRQIVVRQRMILAADCILGLHQAMADDLAKTPDLVVQLVRGLEKVSQVHDGLRTKQGRNARNRGHSSRVHKASL
jgi:hypothetical protein